MNFQFSLFQRLRAYLDLLETRPDFSFDSEVTIEDAEPLDLRYPYPPDAAAFSEEASYVGFSYRARSNSDLRGRLYLSLDGSPDDFVVKLPGETDFIRLDEAYALDCDCEGTGDAGWLCFQDGRTFVLWSLDEPVLFKSLSAYLTQGARRAFAQGWQYETFDFEPLSALSLPRTTPPETLRALILAQGHTAAMADDLIRWLGDDLAFAFSKSA